MRWIQQTIVGLIIMGSVIAPTFVLADEYGIDATANAVGGNVLPKTVAGASTIPGVIGNVVAVALSLLGVIFFLLVLYAGFRWMTAQGNTEVVTTSKGILEAAAIGLVIVIGAYAITSFVLTSVVPGK